MSVKFHLPGLRANFPINMLLVKMMQTYPEYFREGLEIASFFGEFPTSKWNGGRYCGGDQCNVDYIRQVIRAVNAEGIPIRFTYTNPLITEEDLADPYCNFCLLEANNGMNEVIVVSPLLEEYIRECYQIPLTVEEIMDGVNRTVEDFYFHTVQPKKGVVAFLEQMKKQGVKMCIATATDRYQVEAALKRCGMESFFSEIFTCTELGHGKDEPHIFRQGLELLGTDRENTLVFEDSCYAVLTAVKDGFRVIGIHDSQEKRQEEIKAGAEKYIKDFSEFSL